jgi:hypothetical protein
LWLDAPREQPSSISASATASVCRLADEAELGLRRLGLPVGDDKVLRITRPTSAAPAVGGSVAEVPVRGDCYAVARAEKGQDGV